MAQEEAEAIKTGKKIKKRSRKSGFLGLWGKEIESKPVGLDGEEGKVLIQVGRRNLENMTRMPRRGSMKTLERKSRLPQNLLRRIRMCCLT